jgi:thiol-disulfide isomerase/thioredoxin
LKRSTRYPGQTVGRAQGWLLLLWLVGGLAPGVGAEPPNAPDWTLRTTDGATVRLSTALSKGPVLVSFWALWCAPCLSELPHLDALARETAGRVTVFAVNADTPQGVARVRPYLQSKQLGLTVPLDTAGNVQRLLAVGGILPFLVLYDGQGNEAYRHVGYREGDEVVLREKVLALLGEPPPGAPE